MPSATKTATAASRVLIDSDVLIWLTRGNTNALAMVQNTPDWVISAVSYMELAQGCRNKTELKAIQKAFKSSDDEALPDILPITQTISNLACSLVEKYALSHSVHLADALIAATAMTHSLTLLTANNKHFSVIDDLRILIFNP
ncbi:MAG TPA: type II toxin-antitoxin system VapC family toxin [Burkholderiaceae bacterium]|nr:type II toxin-antitoxin system VapC family toxin [Burkholderiaceae bacterium]